MDGVNPLLCDKTLRCSCTSLYKLVHRTANVSCICPSSHYVTPPTSCSPCTTIACSPGTFLAATCTAMADKKCSVCLNGTYSAIENADSCTPWVVCDTVARAGNATHNRICVKTESSVSLSSTVAGVVGGCCTALLALVLLAGARRRRVKRRHHELFPVDGDTIASRVTTSNSTFTASGQSNITRHGVLIASSATLPGSTAERGAELDTRLITTTNLGYTQLHSDHNVYNGEFRKSSSKTIGFESGLSGHLIYTFNWRVSNKRNLLLFNRWCFRNQSIWHGLRR